MARLVIGFIVMLPGLIAAQKLAIAEGLGRWDPAEITAKMSIATPEECTLEDDVFFKAYVEWRSRNPI